MVTKNYHRAMFLPEIDYTTGRRGMINDQYLTFQAVGPHGVNLGSGWILARSGPGPADFIANQKTGELIPISAVSRLIIDN